MKFQTDTIESQLKTVTHTELPLGWNDDFKNYRLIGWSPALIWLIIPNKTWRIDQSSEHRTGLQPDRVTSAVAESHKPDMGSFIFLTKIAFLVYHQI